LIDELNTHLTTTEHAAWGEYLEKLCDGIDIRDWPPSVGYGSISDLTSRLRSMTGIVTEASGKKDNTVTTQELTEIANKTDKMCGGLCLPCIKQHGVDVVSECKNAAHLYP
jgi:hypothetical protein